MTRPVKNIKLAGFRSIKTLDLDLSSLTVMIGANGAGKTNLISFFNMLNAIVNGQLQVFVGKAGGANAILHYGRKTTERLSATLTFGDNSYSCKLTPTAKDAFIFESESVGFKGDRIPSFHEYPIGKGSAESGLKSIAPVDRGHTVAQYVLPAIMSWKLFHFHDTSDAAKVKQTCDINDNQELRGDASNLAAILFKLQQTYPNHYQQIKSIIQLIAPYFDDFILAPSPLNPDKIRLQWKHNGSDSFFDANQFSDGTLRTICLATLINQPNLPTTILIDEPELGLHPYAINVLAGLLRSASKNTQIIVSTQSVPLVNQLTPEDILVVDRENDASVFRRLKESDFSNWLDDYGLGDLWEKNLLGGRPQR